jgi:formyl-CoA transferase
MGDHPTAVSLYAAILTALIRRDRTGKGSHVQTNLMHNGVWANTCLASAAWVDGVDFSPMKIRGPVVSRVLYPTSDGRLLQLYMVRTQAELDAMLIAAEAFDLVNDERFRSLEARMVHAQELIDALRVLFVQRTASEWMALFRAADVPVSMIAELADLTDDIQMQAVGVVSPPTDPGVGARFVINHPVTVDGMPRVGALHAPDCGEHTEEILRERGMTAEQIAALRARGAI